MSNGLRKRALVIFCASVLLLGALPARGVKSHPVANVGPNPGAARQEQIPDHIVYRTLFHTASLLSKQADEAERAGRSDSARAFRRALVQDAGLSDEQSAILNGVAAESERAVRAVDAKARRIIEARRASYPGGVLPAGQEPLPPSPELAELQQQRDAIILRYRDRLREAFGVSEWEQFERIVAARVAAGIGLRGARPQTVFVKASLRATAAAAQTQPSSVITGSTLISFNAYTNLVTAVATTQLDYAAQDWYQGRVSASIRDASGNILTSGVAYDNDRDGTVSVTLQTAGQDQMTYSARATYGARVEIQDYNMGGGYYIDYWNYQQVQVGPEGGTYYYVYMPFYAYGPRRTTRLQNLLLGETTPPTIQAKGDLKAKKPTLTANPIQVSGAQSSPQQTEVVTQVETSTFGLEANDRVVVEVQTVLGDNSAITWANGQVSQPTQINRGGLTSVTVRINGVNQPGDYQFRARIVDVQRLNPTNGQYFSIFGNVTVSAGDPSDVLRVNP